MPKASSCLICRKNPVHDHFSPFCSARCAQIDLHRWFGETYRAPTEETPGLEETEESTETAA